MPPPEETLEIQAGAYVVAQFMITMLDAHTSGKRGRRSNRVTSG